jgi:beta-lactamase regulating signal transducer with metallopeptidase domain
MILFKNVILTNEITNEKQTSRNYIYLLWLKGSWMTLTCKVYAVNYINIYILFMSSDHEEETNKKKKYKKDGAVSYKYIDTPCMA